MLNQKQENETTNEWLTLLVLCGATLVTTVIMAWFVTERIPHLEDEITYLFQARTFARGELTAPLPPDKSSFFTPFVLEVERRMMGKYPIGWPLLLAVGESLNAGWLVNPLIASATVGLVYLIGRRLFDHESALVASALMFTSPFFLIQSASYMSHTTTLFWGTLTWWVWLRLENDEGSPWWAAGAGAALGMMFITRQLPTAIIGLSLGLIPLIKLMRGTRTLKETLQLYWPMALTALLIGASQPLYLWVTTGDPRTNLYTMIWPYDRLGFGPGIGPYEGHTLQQGLITARQDLRLWASDLFGLRGLSWLPLIPGLVFAWLHLRKNKRLAWLIPHVLPFALLVGIHVAYWVGAKVYGPRYYYEAFTGVALLAGVGLVHTVRWVSQRITREVVWPAYGLLVVMLLFSVTGHFAERIAFWHGMYGITREPIETLHAIRETDKVIVLVRGCCWDDYGSLFYLNNPWYDGPIVAAHDESAFQARVLIQEYFPKREVWYYNDGVFSREPSPYEDDTTGD